MIELNKHEYEVWKDSENVHRVGKDNRGNCAHKYSI